MRNHPCISLSDKQRIHLEYLLDNLQERIGAEDVLEVNLQQQRLTLELIKSMGQTFCYEIIVDAEVVTVITLVTDLDSAEWNVSYHYIEKAIGELGIFKPFYQNICLGI